MKKPIRRSRMLGWDRNPLRRRIDRLEAVMIVGLIAVFLIAGPVLVAVAMHWTRAAGLQQQRAEATWRQVAATVARSAPTQRNGSLGPADTFWTLARWAAPDGQPRNGWIPVSPHVTAGSSARKRPGARCRPPWPAAHRRSATVPPGRRTPSGSRRGGQHRTDSRATAGFRSARTPRPAAACACGSTARAR